MKKCSHCKEIKPFDDFHRSSLNKSGYYSQCKNCRHLKRKALKTGKSNRDISNLPNEYWKDLKGFEGIYQISNLGRVKSLERKVSDPYPVTGYRIIKPSILKVTFSSGYPSVRLTKNKKSKNYSIHVLLFAHFSNKPLKDGFVVDHINNNRNDYRLENLQLIPQRYNSVKDKGRGNLLGSFYIKPKSKDGEPRWDARIRLNNERIHLGRFDNPYDAHKRYLKEYKKIHGSIPEVF
ncbi:NUMOD4 motif-containing HNH endonuclease [Pleomorphovibrio marinus]|uniref:NUMOD4 motif-containing HNH endonuclease n=1 Tax=Pleomorphovibrio marinus TaxID=2164132 RepID=UPI0018E53476|nr:NUMOD4 motif-containing HNH endonuclease [Pleomorphovibrio marinus]